MSSLPSSSVDRWWGRVGQTAIATVLLATIGWPLIATVLESLRGDQGTAIGSGLISSTGLARESSLIIGPAWATCCVTGTAVAIASLIGLPLAVLLFRTDLPGHRIILGLMGAILFLPMPVYVAGWLGGFGNAGYEQLFGSRPILRGWVGAGFVHGMAGIPWMVLLGGVGLRSADRRMEESALLDLPAWRVLIEITLRQSVGAILGAALVVAVLTSSDMTVTDILVVRTFAEEAYVQNAFGRPPAVIALVAIPPTVVFGTLLFLGSLTILQLDPARVASPSIKALRWRLGPWRWWIAVLVGLTTAAILGPPILAMFWRAGRVGNPVLSDAPASTSMIGMFRTLYYSMIDVSGPLIETSGRAALGAGLTTATAWSLAWLARGPGPWRWVTCLVVALLLALPGPVAGIALKLAYRLIGPIHDTSLIVLLGYLQRSLPFAILICWPAIRTIPETVLESSIVDGSTGPAQLIRIAIPMTSSAIIGAWGVSFVIAMGELPITNLVEPPGINSLPVFIWQQMHFGVDSRISGIGICLLVFYGAISTAAVFGLGQAYRSQQVTH